MADIVDVPDCSRVSKEPDGIRVLLDGRFMQDEYAVTHVELRLYNEKADKELGTYCLITSFVQTDSDSIEMVYDEGYRGQDPLDRATAFLMENLGIAGLVLRSVIALRSR